jgi:hypothetical protein
VRSHEPLRTLLHVESAAATTASLHDAGVGVRARAHDSNHAIVLSGHFCGDHAPRQAIDANVDVERPFGEVRVRLEHLPNGLPNVRATRATTELVLRLASKKSVTPAWLVNAQSRSAASGHPLPASW